MKTILVVLAGLITGCGIVNNDFKSTLQGDITFTSRNNNGISELYTISANGKNINLVHKNTDKINSNIIYPYWSENKDKIKFTAMQDGTWERFEVGRDGTKLRVLPNAKKLLGFSTSRDKRIIVEEGSIFYSGKKIFSHWFYEYKFNMGVHEASFGPNMKNIIFAYNGGIWIVSKNGEEKAKITEGGSPDWQ